MSTISTHILDTASGRPAEGMHVQLERMENGGWTPMFEGTTNADGRVTDLAPNGISPGIHRMTFGTGDYHRAQGVAGFYPQVRVCFEIGATDEHYHVPLLISPFGFSTYRGS